MFILFHSYLVHDFRLRSSRAQSAPAGHRNLRNVQAPFVKEMHLCIGTDQVAHWHVLGRPACRADVREVGPGDGHLQLYQRLIADQGAVQRPVGRMQVLAAKRESLQWCFDRAIYKLIRV